MSRTFEADRAGDPSPASASATAKAAGRPQVTGVARKALCVALSVLLAATMGPFAQPELLSAAAAPKEPAASQKEAAAQDAAAPAGESEPDAGIGPDANGEAGADAQGGAGDDAQGDPSESADGSAETAAQESAPPPSAPGDDAVGPGAPASPEADPAPEPSAGSEAAPAYADWADAAAAVESGELAGEGFKPSGRGTQEDPYRISTPEAFAWWACLRAADEGGFAVLEADVDLTARLLGGSGDGAEDPLPWPGDAVLAGELDGAGHRVAFRTQGAGLFGEVAQTGAVRWLTVGEAREAAAARAAAGRPAAGTFAAGERAGSVAGVNRGAVEGVVNLAPVRAGNVDDGADPNAAALAGGIVGENDGRVADCANLGDVSNASAAAQSAAAGIAGAGKGSIAASYNAGSVRAAANGAYLTAMLTADGAYADHVDAASCYLAPGEGATYEGASPERPGALSAADLAQASDRLNDGREGAAAVWHEGAADGVSEGYPAPSRPAEKAQADDAQTPALTSANSLSEGIAPRAATPDNTLQFGNYDITDLTCELASYAATFSSVEIPSQVSHNGQMYTVIGIREMAFYGNTDVKRVVIPDTVGYIAPQAFSGCTSLEYVDFGSGIEDIGGEAFKDCISLKDIRWASSVTTADPSAGYPLGRVFIDSPVEHMTIASESVPMGLAYGMTLLTSVDLEDTVKSIGNAAFTQSSNLKSIVIPASVTSIGSEAFLNCSALETVEVGEGVTSFGSKAFTGCTGIKSVRWLPKSAPTFDTSIGALFGDADLTLESVSVGTTVEVGIFTGLKNLSSVVFEDGATSVGVKAFMNCRGITSVIFPQSMTSIGSMAFQQCTNANLVVKFLCTPLSTIVANDAFWRISESAKLMVMTEDDATTALANWDNTPSVDNILYPQEPVAGGETVTIDGVTYAAFLPTGSSIPCARVVGYDGTKASSSSVVIPETVPFTMKGAVVQGTAPSDTFDIYVSVTQIAADAFANSSNITSLTLPDSIETIESGAFSTCTNLRDVDLGDFELDPSKLDYIFKNTVDHITSLTTAARSVGPDAMSVFYRLASVCLDGTDQVIERSAFKNRTTLSSVRFVGTNQTLSNQAFSGTNIREVEIPASVTTFEEDVFVECEKLKKITISRPVRVTTGTLFANCSNVEDVIIRADVEGSLIANTSSAFPQKINVTVEGAATLLDGPVITTSEIGMITLKPDGVLNIGSDAFTSALVDVLYFGPDGHRSTDPSAIDGRDSNVVFINSGSMNIMAKVIMAAGSPPHSGSISDTGNSLVPILREASRKVTGHPTIVLVCDYDHPTAKLGDYEQLWDALAWDRVSEFGNALGSTFTTDPEGFTYMITGPGTCKAVSYSSANLPANATLTIPEKVVPSGWEGKNALVDGVEYAPSFTVEGVGTLDSNGRFFTRISDGHLHDITELVVDASLGRIETGTLRLLTGLTDIKVNPKSGSFASANFDDTTGNEALVSKDGTSIVYAPGTKGKVVIPETVKVIESDAYPLIEYSEGITALDLPRSLERVERDSLDCSGTVVVDLGSDAVIEKNAMVFDGATKLYCPASSVDKWGAMNAAFAATAFSAELTDADKVLAVKPGATNTLTASANATLFEGAQGKAELVWSSSDEAVAKVAPDATDPTKAIVTGVANGTATITATLQYAGQALKSKDPLTGLMVPVTSTREVKVDDPTWAKIGEQVVNGTLVDSTGAVVAGPKGGGSSAVDPYLIGTPEELAAYAWAANNDKAFNNGANARTAYVKLTADIDLAGAAYGGSTAAPLPWEPMGTSSKEYKGHIDGAGHEIDHLYFNDNTRVGAGLVGWARGVTIENLGIGAGSSIIGNKDVAAFVGACTVVPNSLTINNCYNRATVNGTGEYIYAFLGDDSGQHTAADVGSITNCYNAGNASFAAMSSGKIDNCYADTEQNQNAASYVQHDSAPGSGVKALTTKQMKSWAASWALNSKKLDGAWATDSSTPKNDGYPVLGNPLRAAADWGEVGLGVDAGLIGAQPKGDGLATGSGDTGPFQIGSPEQLAWFAYKVNSGSLAAANQNAKLTAGIDLAGTQYTGASGPGADFADSLRWNAMTPRGRSSEFAGTFNGAGNSVSSVHAYEGVFGAISGTVQDFGVSSGCIEGELYDKTIYLGAIASDVKSGGKVERCFNAASVVAHDASAGYIYVGGVAGELRGGASVKDCYNVGEVSVIRTSGIKQEMFVGGVVGNVDGGRLENSYGAGPVTASDSSGGTGSGGILATARNGGTVVNGFYDSNATLKANVPVKFGTSKTTEELQSAAMVIQLNTSARRGPARVWKAVSGGYPVIDTNQGKEDQAAPAAPTVKRFDDVSGFSVTTALGQEYYYSSDATPPGDSPDPNRVFAGTGQGHSIGGCAYHTKYYFYTRLVGNDTFNTSPWSAVTVVMTKGPVSAPALSGTATVKQTLTAAAAPSDATGTWQWQRSDSSDAKGTWTVISGATTTTYTLTADDAGRYVRAALTGTGEYYGTKYSPASAQVSRATQDPLTVTITPSSVKFGKTAQVTVAGGSGSGKLSYMPSVASIASVDGNGLITTNKVGSTAIKVTKSGDGEYLSQEGVATLTVTPGDQAALSLGFNSDSSGTTKTVKWGETAPLYAKGGSGNGAVTYTSSNTDIATVDSSGKITAKGAVLGDVTFTATKAAEGNYLAATSNKVTLTVTLGDVPAPTGLTGTGAKGPAKGFIKGTSALMQYTGPSAAKPAAGDPVYSCIGDTAPVDKAGTYWVRYAASTTQNASDWAPVVIPLGTQTLTTQLSATSISTLTKDAKATATSNAGTWAPDKGTITYHSSDEAVATVDQTTGVITPVAAGTANIYATITADSTYDAAQSANVQLTVMEGTWAGIGASAAAGTLAGFTVPTQDGNGVYQIGNAEQLAWFAYKVNNDNATFGAAKAKLTADIDLSGIAYTGKSAAEVAADATKALPWMPIGYDYTTPFAGSFDGAGHSVSNMLVDVTTEFAGMFGYFTGERIENVHVASGRVFGNSYGAGGIVGVFGSQVDATIANCANAAAVSGMFAGGIVGASYYTSGLLTVADCLNSGDIVGQVSGLICNAGGIAGLSNDGDADRRFERCANVGTVSATHDAGGIIGSSVTSTVEDCYNRGDIESIGVDGSPAAGISTYSDEITNCYNVGKVSAANSSGCAIARSGNVANCYALENVASDYTGVTALTDAEMKSWALPYKLNGRQYVGSTDGTQPASTVWTTDASDTAAQTNGGYPVFGNLYADKLTAELDPAGVLADVSGAPAKKVTGDLMKDGAKHSLSGEVTLLSAPANPTDATLGTATDVDAGFSTWGTTSANANVALVVGSTPLKPDTPVDASIGTDLASIDLHAAAAYTYDTARPVKFVVVDASMGYEVTATVKAVASKKLDVTLPVEAASSFGLKPDGKVHEGGSAAKSGALSLTSNSGVPVAGKVSSVAPLAVGTETAFKQTVNAQIAPTAQTTVLKPSKDPVTQAGQAKLYVAASGTDASLTQLDAAQYYDPGTGTVPLWFAMPGTNKVAWKWGLDYTGTHAGAAGVFGYSTGFTLGLPVKDVPAPVLSDAEIGMVTAGVTAGAAA